MDLTGIETPSLVLDRTVLRRNIDGLEARCAQLGVRFRPHMKTVKSVDAGRMVPSAMSHGITVSTVREAEAFAAAGVRDIFYAVSADPRKSLRLIALQRGNASRVTLAVDSAEQVRALDAALGGADAGFPVLVEVDCGEHRSGIQPDSDQLPNLLDTLSAARHLWFRGVFTHGGHAYEARGPDALQQVARAERDAVVHVAARCAERGRPCQVVSVGSSPTLAFADHLQGVTEVRAGVALLQDVFQVGLGCCSTHDIAATVLTTVIGHQPANGTLIIDAGGLALSKDHSTASLGPDLDCGYGLIADQAGRLIPNLRVVATYQEHGIAGGPDLILDRFPRGTLLRVLPNHACMTCAQHDRYHVLDGEDVIGTWERVNGW